MDLSLITGVTADRPRARTRKRRGLGARTRQTLAKLPDEFSANDYQQAAGFRARNSGTNQCRLLAAAKVLRRVETPEGTRFRKVTPCST